MIFCINLKWQLSKQIQYYVEEEKEEPKGIPTFILAPKKSTPLSKRKKKESKSAVVMVI